MFKVKAWKAKAVQEMHSGAGIDSRNYGFVALFAILTECYSL